MSPAVAFAGALCAVREGKPLRRAFASRISPNADQNRVPRGEKGSHCPILTRWMRLAWLLRPAAPAWGQAPPFSLKMRTRYRFETRAADRRLLT